MCQISKLWVENQHGKIHNKTGTWVKMYFWENRVLVFINICKNDISGNNAHRQVKISIHEDHAILCQLTQTQVYTAIQFYLYKKTSTPHGCHGKKIPPMSEAASFIAVVACLRADNLTRTPGSLFLRAALRLGYTPLICLRRRGAQMSATRQPHRGVRPCHCRLHPLVELGDRRARSRLHPNQACEAHLRALGPHLRVKTLVGVLRHPSQAATQQVLVAETRVDRPHARRDFRAEGSADVLAMRPRLLVRCECPLVKTPAVWSTGASRVVVVVIGGRGMEQRGEHGIAHAVQVTRMTTDRLAIVGRQLRDRHLGELAIAASTESRAALLLLGDHLPQGRAQPLRHVVDAFFLVDWRAVVQFEVTQMLVGAGVAVGEHRGVAEAVRILRPPPHHLGRRLLHRSRRAGVVAAAGGVLLSPSVELLVVVPVVSSGDGTALAVERHDVVVDDEARHHLHHEPHTVQGLVAPPHPGAVKADGQVEDRVVVARRSEERVHLAHSPRSARHHGVGDRHTSSSDGLHVRVERLRMQDRHVEETAELVESRVADTRIHRRRHRWTRHDERDSRRATTSDPIRREGRVDHLLARRAERLQLADHAEILVGGADDQCAWPAQRAGEVLDQGRQHCRPHDRSSDDIWCSHCVIGLDFPVAELSLSSGNRRGGCAGRRWLCLEKTR